MDMFTEFTRYLIGLSVCAVAVALVVVVIYVVTVLIKLITGEE